MTTDLSAEPFKTPHQSIQCIQSLTSRCLTMRFPLMFALLLCLAHCKNTTQNLEPPEAHHG